MSVDFKKGHDDETGQMSVEERKILYNIAIEKKPKIIVDVGTWKGNGSTYILASAVKANGKGHVYTIEQDAEMCKTAVKNYGTSELKMHISFINRDSAEAISWIGLKLKRIDLLMLDGNRSYDDYKAAFSWFFEGAVVACHDWKEAKCKGLRKELYSRKWKEIAYSKSNANHFAVFQRV